MILWGESENECMLFAWSTNAVSFSSYSFISYWMDMEPFFSIHNEYENDLIDSSSAITKGSLHTGF